MTGKNEREYGKNMEIVDHVPSIDSTRPTMRDAYNKTRKIYEQIFGQPDTKIWTDVVATCGDSYSGYVPAGTDISADDRAHR